MDQKHRAWDSHTLCPACRPCSRRKAGSLCVNFTPDNWRALEVWCKTHEAKKAVASKKAVKPRASSSSSRGSSTRGETSSGRKASKGSSTPMESSSSKGSASSKGSTASKGSTKGSTATASKGSSKGSTASKGSVTGPKAVKAKGSSEPKRVERSHKSVSIASTRPRASGAGESSSGSASLEGVALQEAIPDSEGVMATLAMALEPSVYP